MSWFYRRIVRPSLFRADPEEAHDMTLRALGWMSQDERLIEAVGSFFEPPQLPITIWGLSFPNPVGVAAGLDKSARALPIWQSLGFGFTELGGITFRAQDGNPKPRLFRVPEDEALINRMGFNNPGAEAVAHRLAEWRAKSLWPSHPVGLNLGKSKAVPLSEAAADYANSFRALWPYGDFFVVNVSSPNTPGLTELQDKDALEEIIDAIQEVNLTEAAHTTNPRRTKPILAKVSPDLSFAGLDQVLEVTGPGKIAGLVATNTTLARPGKSERHGDTFAPGVAALRTHEPKRAGAYAEAGGLSGRPLRSRSTEVIRHLFRQTGGSLPIIGVGGIVSAADAWEKIAAGAWLVQIYTGLVYEGPSLASDIVTGLKGILEAKGYPDLTSAVGADN